MATQNSTLRGNCVAPFLDASRFPQHEGFVDGRLCAKIEGLDGAPTCCLPCPASAWAYSDRFETYNTASEWLNVVGFALLCFMLISYIVLPAQQTRSHYLSVCLIISVMMITLGFTVPLAARPEQCYNEITPNDMYTSMSCAWGGAFIVAGGLSVVMWVLIRALSMNLQICWDIVPGRRFFYVSLMFGWGIPAVLFLLTITLTGVSFRFGSACHVNHAHSMGDFWGPLTAMAGIAGVLQIMTLVYCGHVYMRNLWSDEPDPSTATSEGLPSYQGSTHTKTARAVYRRLKRVLWLQWRGICIVTIILVDIIFFTVVFIRMDTMQNGAKNNYAKVVPWLACLASNPTDKNQCLHLVNDFVVAEPAVAAVLFMLGFAGFEVFFLLTRPSIFPAWLDFFRSFGRPKRQAFVTLDATPPDLTRSTSHSASESALSSPQSTYQTPLHRGQSPALMTYATHHRPGYQRESSNDWANNHVYELSDRNGDEGRQYQRPMTSFSRPAAPARVSFSEPGGTLARGGLGQNPPSEASESRENSGHVRAASKNAPKLRLHHYERNGRI
ncbi:hypothetical protein CERZMDRAFT_119367 [Cercospora zeae-maydis SCOH1-5]|uniref:G-protein coupled receptors family 2 profile 2 domain-containing protein n=1 Tax=Cercospora zeae-maydis SCOH1-5 TaxID=717836 RepID=A0A6A6FVZ1_9PEZI|nr:hypothetical protein CERZMDRAFT_119367 [Cercospora zeae-maydis SCOH1-5]